VKEFLRQDGEPDLDLVEPRGVLGREVEGDVMLRLAQECLTGCFGGQYAGLAFDAEVAFEAAVAGQRGGRRTRRDVEIVAD
jgi:hypothetical protein